MRYLERPQLINRITVCVGHNLFYTHLCVTSEFSLKSRFSKLKRRWVKTYSIPVLILYYNLFYLCHRTMSDLPAVSPWNEMLKGEAGIETMFDTQLDASFGQLKWGRKWCKPVQLCRQTCDSSPRSLNIKYFIVSLRRVFSCGEQGKRNDKENVMTRKTYQEP